MFLPGICVFFSTLQRRGIIALSTGSLPSLKTLLTVILNEVKRNEESQNTLTIS